MLKINHTGTIFSNELNSLLTIENAIFFIKLFNVGFINRRQSVNDIFHIFTEYAIISASNDL